MKRMFAWVAAAGLMGACGQGADVQPTRIGVAQRALGETGDTVNLQTRVIEGEFNDNDNSLECVTIRAKVFKDRSGVKLTNEWKAVSSSSQYVALQEDRAHWAGAGCNNPASSTPTPACRELAGKVSTDGDTLAETALWTALTGTSNFSGLFNDWGRATQLNCVKFD